MRTLIRNIKITAVIFIFILTSLLGGLVYQQKRSTTEFLSVAGENKSGLADIYGRFAGQILSADGFVLAGSSEGRRVYPDEEEASSSFQLVGDYTHNMTNTIENIYQSTLTGKQRSLLNTLLMDFRGMGNSGDNITLSIRHDFSQKISDILGDQKGSAVLMNWQTGEILASVSKPVASYEDVINYNSDNFQEGALKNKAFDSYSPPGSTFKLFTAAAWLNSPVYDPNFVKYVDSRYSFDGGPIDREGLEEGEVDLKKAFAESRNLYFGDLSEKIGRQNFLDYMKSIGFYDPIFVDKIPVADSTFSIPENNRAALAWAGTGQPDGVEIEVSPLRLCLYASCLANDGLMLQPKIIKNITLPTGRISYELKPEKRATPFSSDTVSKLDELMQASGEYANAYLQNGELLRLKTGTAEREGEDHKNVGVINSYLKDPKHPYALCIIMEDVESSSEVVLLAKKIYNMCLDLS